MRLGFPTRINASKMGETGVNIVSKITTDHFGWLFKRNHQEHDFGIDGQLEVITQDGVVTGQMLAVQIKCGKSFFIERNRWGYVYRGEIKHFNYLSNYPVPIVICLCDPESEKCYWVHFREDQVQLTEAGWKITVPFENDFSSSRAELEALVPELYDRLSELQSYWKLNELIVESSVIQYVIGKEDIVEKNASFVRDFFDRLKSTKELAHECQGKVEISFHGYDDDSRELCQIDEVRDYVTFLSPQLPELFFFARTEAPTGTILTFALCQTEVEFKDTPSANATVRAIEFDNKPVVKFVENHFYGLNEMTDWVSMAVEENKRITFEIFKCLGWDVPQDEM